MRLDDEKLIYRNPGTSQDLVIGVNLYVPVEDHEIRRNFRQNQIHDVPWIDEAEAHGRTAIICGAGPSLRDTLDDLKAIDGDIFASNSACKFLADSGLTVHNQVVLDPHPIALTNFDHRAERHLLASTVDPTFFYLSANAALWHPNLSWLDEELKDGHPQFMYIGGGITVTNSSMCLAYTMGYREFHVFGMDSSYKGQDSHVIAVQELPAFNLIITENGKEYLTAWDLKQQVMIYREIHRQLEGLGCKIKVHGSGLLPDMFKTQPLEK